MFLKQLRFHSFAYANGIFTGRNWELKFMTKFTGFLFHEKERKNDLSTNPYMPHFARFNSAEC